MLVNVRVSPALCNYKFNVVPAWFQCSVGHLLVLGNVTFTPFVSNFDHKSYMGTFISSDLSSESVASPSPFLLVCGLDSAHHGWSVLLRRPHLHQQNTSIEPFQSQTLFVTHSHTFESCRLKFARWVILPAQ
jgi:hypothetical protein